MGEQVVAHAVLRFARGVQHQVTRAGAERCLERGETDDEECESQDVLELSSRTPERIDDRADEPRWHDRRERASGREDSAGDELEAVASKVMEEGGAGRGHSVTSVLGRIPLSRAFLLRTQPPPPTIAAQATTSPVPIAFGRRQRAPTTFRNPRPATTPIPAGPTRITTLRSPTFRTSRTKPGASAPAIATSVYVSAM